MQTAIDKDKFTTIKRLTSSATLEDVFYAYKTNKITAVLLIMQNPDIKEALYDRCPNLSLEDKRFLLGGTNPKDLASVIKNLTD